MFAKRLVGQSLCLFIVFLMYLLCLQEMANLLCILIASALFSQASIIYLSPSPLRTQPFRTPRGNTFCVASRDYLLSVFSSVSLSFSHG